MIENGVLTQTSVSEIETFDENQVGGCPRRWWFERAHDLKPEQARSQEEGECGHAHLARYLSTGEMPPKRKLMSKAATGAIVKGKLPKPAPDLLVERRFSGQEKFEKLCRCGHDEAAHSGKKDACAVTVPGADSTTPSTCECAGFNPRWIPLDVEKTLKIAGVPLEGFIDLAYLRGELGVIIDHKFFGPVNPAVSDDPYHWLKRGEDLMKTVQMPVYAAAMLREWADVRSFRLAHHYVSKKGVDSLFRAATVTPSQVATRMMEITKLVERMKALAGATDQEQVPPAASAQTPTKDACRARKGCPHQSICSAFTNRRTPAMTLNDDELAVFTDVPGIDDPVTPTPALSDDVPELDEPVAGAPAPHQARARR